MTEADAEQEFFRDMRPSEMQHYFRSLFRALDAVHKHGILHRDIKPTYASLTYPGAFMLIANHRNFLYDPWKGKGVLVDFGLAEVMLCSFTFVADPANVEIERGHRLLLLRLYRYLGPPEDQD